MCPQNFAGYRAEMLDKTAAPHRGDLVTGLQHGPQSWRLPAANEPGVPPVVAGQKLDDDAAFAIAAGRQHEPGITPIHQAS